MAQCVGYCWGTPNRNSLRFEQPIRAITGTMSLSEIMPHGEMDVASDTETMESGKLTQWSRRQLTEMGKGIFHKDFNYKCLCSEQDALEADDGPSRPTVSPAAESVLVPQGLSTTCPVSQLLLACSKCFHY